MIKELIRLANQLDSKGLRKEADYIDSVIRKVAAEMYGSALAKKLASAFSAIIYKHPEFYGELTAIHASTDQGSETSTYSLEFNPKRGSSDWAKLIKGATKEQLESAVKTAGHTVTATTSDDGWPKFLRTARAEDGLWVHWRVTISGGDENAELTVVMTKEKEIAGE